MSFQMACPKCGSRNFSIDRDNRAYSQRDEAFQLIFSCRCGKQMFGQAVLDEYEGQKKDWDGRPAQAQQTPAVAAAARQAEEAELRRRQDTARRAYLEEQRKEAAKAQEMRGAAPRRAAPKPAAPAAPPAPRVRPAAAPSAPTAPAVVAAAEPVVALGPTEAIPEGLVCAWATCENARRKNSKYCSRACSNKNARSRYKNRKGGEAAA